MRLDRLGWHGPALALLLATTAYAQPAFYESEPNNTPAEANKVAGEVTIMGAFEGQDQDAFEWTVSDVDAQKRWTLELTGLPGTVTSTEIFRLEFADNGVDVVAKTKILKINSKGIKPGRAADLIFEPGDYFLGVARAGSGTGGYRLLIHEGRKLRLASRAKGFDTQESAHKIKLRAEYAAFLDAPESWFKFDLKEEDAALRWQVRGQVPAGEKGRGAVVDSSGKTVSRISGDNAGLVRSGELELDPGTYFVMLEGKEGGAIRAVEIASIGPREEAPATPAPAAKPDAKPRTTQSRWELAERVDLAEPIEGRFGRAKDVRFYSFHMDEETVDEVFALGLECGPERTVDLCLLNSLGKPLQCRKGTGGVSLPDLLLSAGDWGLSITGRAGGESPFTVALSSQGPIQPGGEAEPNDKPLQATGISAQQEIRGRFAMKDEDYFSMLVTGEPQLWRFDVSGEGLIELRYHDGAGLQSQSVRAAKGATAVSLVNLFLMPGKHHFAVKGQNGTYTLSAQSLGPPDPNSELEPNDDASRAEVLGWGQNRFGVLENASDLDFYRFSLTNDEHLRLSVDRPGDSELHVWLDYGSAQFATHRIRGGGPAVVQGMFPPGDYQIRLGRATSPDPYHLQLERLPRFGCTVDCEPIHRRKVDFGDTENPTSAPIPLPMEMRIDPEAKIVAAYLRLGQRVPAILRLDNKGAGPLSIELETTTSDYRWSAVPAESNLELEAGQTTTVDLDITVPPDAWGDLPVVISARAFDNSGAQIETAVEIGVDGKADPVHPELAWPIPDAMLGGANVAWSELGGRLVGVKEGSNPVVVPGAGRHMNLLIDGKVRPTAGPILSPEKGGDALPITVDLAGDEELQIVGVLLNPVGRENPHKYVDEFKVQLSRNGVDFETVLHGQLRPLPFEQAFALEEPTAARFARLVVLSTHDDNLSKGAGLGEWKVVARPGVDVSNSRGWNLADPELGGHVTWARPTLSGPWDRHILTDKKEKPTVTLAAGQGLEWVVSFQHQRSARIARFEWVESEKSAPETRIDQVSVSVAFESPIGPWTKIADWDRTKSPGKLVLDESVWARYVRFTYAGPEERSWGYAPETLRIFEQPSDATYSSILGEWGETSWQAQYELSKGLPGVDAHQASGNNSRVTAAKLEFDQLVKGKVLLGEEEDWYKLSVPAGANTLTITLAGAPTVRTVIQMLDSTGSDVRLQKGGARQDSLQFKALVEPGQAYYLKVEEPPRAVVFAFDNSGSVTAFKNAIYRAVNTYAGDLVPGRDVANILPFGSPFLMTDCVGEPYILQMALNDYDREDNNSMAEFHLDMATRALAPRPGTKAVVLVTDAATPRFSSMWNSLESVQPRVFTMRVANADTTGLYEDLMQSWARVNDGHYDYLTTQAGMDRAFDRAATLLRQPAAYNLEVSAKFERDPGPGKLQIVSGDKNLGGAVALILDASGSMLKRMEGGRRIEVAKNLLAQAVTEHIPPGTPVALRVFGHKEANSCRTDLVVPMKPLDPGAMANTLAGINAKNLAKTPIADSLAKIEADLKGAKGRRVVVLVTDGEETCDGDPEAVLQKLAERGIDLRLEIVGFAIADDDLKQQFEDWAQQGGGRYFDAGDAASLERSLAEALQIPYSVFDQNGSLVAQGTVDGEALELPAGRYRITISTSPPRTLEEVDVPGEQEIVLSADGSSP